MATLSESRIKKLPIGRHGDDATPGLQAVIGKRAISFSFVYKRNGKTQSVSLGKYSDGLTLADARKEASRLHDRLRSGEDPKKQIVAASFRKSSTTTFREAWDQYVDDHLSTRRNTEKEARLIERLAMPTLENRPLIAISKSDARDVVKAAMKSAAKFANAKAAKSGRPKRANAGHYQGKNVQARLKAFFNWAMDRDLVDSNPFVRLGITFNIESRERFLTIAELERVLFVLKSHPSPTYRALIHFLLYTGMRDISEATAMRFGWVDLKSGVETVTVPADAAKNRKINTAALCPRAARLIALMQARAKEQLEQEGRPDSDLADQFVFSSDGKRQYSGLSKDKARLDVKLEEHAEAIGLTNIEHFTHHDLRRSVATNLAMLGVSEETIERGVLRHLPAGKSDLKRTYGRHEYVDEARIALTQLSEALHDFEKEIAEIDRDIKNAQREWLKLSITERGLVKNYDPIRRTHDGTDTPGSRSLTNEERALFSDPALADFDRGHRGRKRRLGILPPSHQGRRTTTRS
ncbi:MAG: integrase family protein [Rhodobiaceae bacterium]|nr:integrase family protein [Rhodobiaceae bacterium]